MIHDNERERQPPGPVRRVTPGYSHRVTPQQIIKTFASPTEAFEHGDYLLAAEYAERGSELHACALVMGGLIEAGIESLQQSAHLSSRGMLSLGFGLWCLERSAEAVEALRQIPATAPEQAAARGLIDLMNRSEINVFIVAAHVPVFSAASEETKRPSYRCGAFHVKHVCSQVERDAYDAEIGQPFDQFIASLPEDEQPHFIYLGTPQWIMPRGFNRVGVPIIAWVHDSDFFMYRSYDNYFSFDVSVVSTSQEHFETRRMFGTFSVSNLLSDPLMRMPVAADRLNTERPIDVLFTGGAISSHATEKSRFMFILSRLADEFRITVVDGHMDEDAYLALVARTKFLPIVNRYYGNPSPRWRDALSQSSYVLYPVGVPYQDLSAGFFPYRHDAIEADIRAHLRQYAAEAGAGRQLEVVHADLRRRFPAVENPRKKQFERTLKFCSLMAIVARTRRLRRPAPFERQRWIWPAALTDMPMYGADNVCGKVLKLIAQLDVDDLNDPVEFNDVAGLHIQLAVVRGETWPAHKTHVDAAIELLERGLRTHPQSLLLRFNRAHWTFMCGPKDRAAAVRRFEELIAEFDTLEFEPRGADIGVGYSGLPSDLVLPYYDYGHAMVEQATIHGRPGELAADTVAWARRFLLSAAHGYVGWARVERGEWLSALARFETALSIFPDNLLIAKLKLQTLWALVDADESQAAHYRHEIVATFFDSVDRDPGLLLTDGLRMMEVLRETKQSLQLMALVDDWYRFAGVIRKVQSADDAQKDVDALAGIFKYEQWFPDALRKKIADWDAGERVPTDLQELDAKLYLVRRRNVATAPQRR